jgi:hypothetical protein
MRFTDTHLIPAVGCLNVCNSCSQTKSLTKRGWPPQAMRCTGHHRVCSCSHAAGIQSRWSAQTTRKGCEAVRLACMQRQTSQRPVPCELRYGLLKATELHDDHGDVISPRLILKRYTHGGTRVVNCKQSSGSSMQFTPSLLGQVSS